MSVRINILWNDTFSQICLTSKNTADNPLRLWKRGPCDEGYHWEETRYWVEEGNIYEAFRCRGRDCDGRYEDSRLFSCPIPLKDADSTTYYQQLIPLPAWAQERSSQRDYSAEAMNY